MKILSHSILLVLSTTALLAAGCSSARRAESLTTGERIVMNVEVDSDGDLQGTSIDVEDDGDVECEQEGEHQGENEGCNGPVAPSSAVEMLVGPVAPGSGADSISILGIDVSVTGESGALTGGTYWFEGSYSGQDNFSGAVVKTSANERLRMLGSIDSVEDLGDGMIQVTVFDRKVRVDGGLILNQVEDLDEAAESDVDCEQEGEHEGENEGC